MSSSGKFTLASVTQEFPFNVTTVTDRTHIAGTSNLDTIVRSAIQNTQTNSSCLHAGNTIFDQIGFGSIRYAFPTTSWL